MFWSKSVADWLSFSLLYSLLDAADIVKHVDTAQTHEKDDHLA